MLIMLDRMYNYGVLLLLVLCLTSCEKLNPCDQYIVDSIINPWKPKLPGFVELAQSLNLTTFIEAFKEAGLDNAISRKGPYTLFAPANEAFIRRPSFRNVALRPLLSNHIALSEVDQEAMKSDLLVPSLLTEREIRINLYNNKTVTANGCKILKGPFRAFNGLLYVVDDVMWTTSDKRTVISELGKFPLDMFYRLRKGFEKNGLEEFLSTKGPFTLLAPMDEAGSKMSNDTIEKILTNPTLWQNVMKHTIVPGVWYTDGLSNGDKLKTLKGDEITVSIKNGVVKMDDAQVVLADYSTENGVIHILDTILLPRELRD